MKKTGFTLVEVLITVVIVGLVAAITLPTLITRIKNKVEENQAAVFNAKFIKGLNLAKTSGDLNNTYSSTYDFLVNGLSKHYKMSKICDSSHIRDCVPYDTIIAEINGKEISFSVKDINTVQKLKLSGGFNDIASFVSGDGIPVILSYDKDCIVDTEELDKSISVCVDGLYDINGIRKPNKLFSKIVTKNGKSVKELSDIRSIRNAKLSKCIGEIGDICVMSAAQDLKHYEMVLAAIQAVDPSYTMPTFVASWNNRRYDDSWQLSKDYCSKVVPGSHLPSKDELVKIAESWYGITISNPTNNLSSNTGAKQAYQDNKTTIYAALGIIDNLEEGLELYSNSDSGDTGALLYDYEEDYTGLDVFTRYKCTTRLAYCHNGSRVVCLGN